MALSTMMHATPPVPRAPVLIQAAHIWRLWPSWRTDIPPHRYPFFNLWWIWSGSGWLRHGAHQSELRPGVCALLRPWGDYEAAHDPAHPIGYIRIGLFFRDSRGRTRNPAESELPPEVQFLPEQALADALLRKVVACHAEADRDGRGVAELYLEAFLRDILRQSARPLPDSQTDRLRPVFAAIQESDRHRFRVAELARRVHLSPNQFGRLFKLATRQTPSRYLAEHRMSRARDLLSSTGLRISEIAEILGYPDVFAFSRQFKRRHGQSPRAWRTSRQQVPGFAYPGTEPFTGSPG